MYLIRSRRWAVGSTALYVLWGVLHLGLGVTMVISGLSGGLPAGELAAESLMFFVCAVVLGAQAIVIAVVLNRVNSRLGYWLNLTVLGVIDGAFVVILVIPGHVDPVGGLSGPVVWLLAAACSTVALRREPVTGWAAWGWLGGLTGWAARRPPHPHSLRSSTTFQQQSDIRTIRFAVPAHHPRVIAHFTPVTTRCNGRHGSPETQR